MQLIEVIYPSTHICNNDKCYYKEIYVRRESDNDSYCDNICRWAEMNGIDEPGACIEYIRTDIIIELSDKEFLI